MATPNGTSRKEAFKRFRHVISHECDHLARDSNCEAAYEEENEDENIDGSSGVARQRDKRQLYMLCTSDTSRRPILITN